MTTLEQALQKAKSELADNPDMLEDDMCKEVIEPVLRALGWRKDSDGGRYKWQHNIWKPQGGNKRADYALIVGDKTSLLIEAKRPGGIHNKTMQREAEEQLGFYATNRFVDVAILTDGDVWRFYLRRKNQQDTKECLGLALEISLRNDKLNCFAERLNDVLSCDAVAHAKAKEQLEKSRARVLLDEAWPGLLENPEIKHLIIGHLRAHAKKCDDTLLEDVDALAFLEEKFSAEQTQLPGNGYGDKPPSSDNVKVILTFDGKETEYDGRPAAVRGLLEWNRPDPLLLSELAKTRHAVKQTARPQYPNGNPDYHWQQSGDYWVHTQVGAPGLQAFIGDYNEITGKGVRGTERKLP